MVPDARALRIGVYDHILSTGLPPSLRQLAGDYDATPADVKQWLADLKIGKTILTHPQTGEIWMAGPFASEETPYAVSGSRTTWWANCAWDMLGIAMIAEEAVRIETRCTDCGEPMALEASPDRPPDSSAVVHFLVPARQWYADIGFT